MAIHSTIVKGPIAIPSVTAYGMVSGFFWGLRVNGRPDLHMTLQTEHFQIQAPNGAAEQKFHNAL